MLCRTRAELNRNPTQPPPFVVASHSQTHSLFDDPYVGHIDQKSEIKPQKKTNLLSVISHVADRTVNPVASRHGWDYPG